MSEGKFKNRMNVLQEEAKNERGKYHHEFRRWEEMILLIDEAAREFPRWGDYYAVTAWLVKWFGEDKK